MEKQVSKNFPQIFLDILNYKFLRTFRKQQLDGMYNNKITLVTGRKLLTGQGFLIWKPFVRRQQLKKQIIQMITMLL